jgi:hypothetical protein
MKFNSVYKILIRAWIHIFCLISLRYFEYFFFKAFFLRKLPGCIANKAVFQKFVVFLLIITTFVCHSLPLFSTTILNQNLNLINNRFCEIYDYLNIHIFVKMFTPYMLCILKFRTILSFTTTLAHVWQTKKMFSVTKTRYFISNINFFVKIKLFKKMHSRCYISILKISEA